MEYTILWDRHPEDVCLVTSGVATVSELHEMVETMIADDRFTTGLRILVDHSATDLAGLTYADVRRRSDLLEHQATSFGAARIAVVTARPVNFGIQRMLDAMTSGRVDFVAHVFQSLDDAHAWLAAGGSTRDLPT